MSAPALFATCTLIWGSTWLGITYQLGTVAAEVSVAYRFAIAAALLAAWCVATGRSLRFSGRDHTFLALQGVLMFGANYIAVYEAERFAPSGLVAVLFSTIVFMNPIGARLAYGTPLTVRMLVAATLGVAGIALLFLPELDAARSGGEVALGIAFGVGGTVSASAGNLVAVRNHRAAVPVFEGSAWGMAYGAAFSALTALALGVPWTFDARASYVLSLAYLTVFGTIVAFGAYLTLLRKVGVGLASFVGIATPVVAMLLSTAFEGYRWTWFAALGVALAIAGNWLALRAAVRG